MTGIVSSILSKFNPGSAYGTLHGGSVMMETECLNPHWTQRQAHCCLVLKAFTLSTQSSLCLVLQCILTESMVKSSNSQKLADSCNQLLCAELRNYFHSTLGHKELTAVQVRKIFHLLGRSVNTLSGKRVLSKNIAVAIPSPQSTAQTCRLSLRVERAISRPESIIWTSAIEGWCSKNRVDGVTTISVRTREGRAEARNRGCWRPYMQ